MMKSTRGRVDLSAWRTAMCSGSSPRSYREIEGRGEVNLRMLNSPETRGTKSWTQGCFISHETERGAGLKDTHLLQNGE